MNVESFTKYAMHVLASAYLVQTYINIFVVSQEKEVLKISWPINDVILQIILICSHLVIFGELYKVENFNGNISHFPYKKVSGVY